MSRRQRYEILTPCRRYILSSFTLYGDHDEDTFRVLNAMIREAIAIGRVSYHESEGVVVRLVELDV